MATKMKASEFIEKLKDVEKNYKTLYVMGCFGAPMTTANKKRYCENHEYNRQAARTKMIQAASADTFGFDCVNLIKGILWGWNGDKKKTYGGAKYNTNGVPDTNADGMINLCSNVTTDFSNIQLGEAVWCKGHIGVYIGDGLAIECTPAWKNRVQITAVGNIGKKAGYNTRKWTKHGKFPFIEYDICETTDKHEPDNKPTTKPAEKKADPAQKFDKTIAGKYKVSGCTSLHIRSGAGTNNASLGILSKDTVVTNHGYYSIAPNGKKWLYVKTKNGVVGFCSSTYLKKC